MNQSASQVLEPRVGESPDDSVTIPTAGQRLGWYGTADVARRFGISQQTVTRRIQEGEIRGEQVGRFWMVPPEEMGRLLASTVDLEQPTNAAEAITALESALEHARAETRAVLAANRDLEDMIAELERLVPAEPQWVTTQVHQRADGRWSCRVVCPDGVERLMVQGTPERLQPQFMSPVRNRREAIPVGLRFEVLSRDGFRCVYCGRGAPDVELHLDHAKPYSKGGPSTAANLVTACQDCNFGKSDTELPTPPHPGSDREGDEE